MTGKQIKSNPFNLLVEYSHFSGTEKEIFLMLNAFLKALLKKEKFYFTNFEDRLKNNINDTLIKFNDYDTCINIFDSNNHSEIFKIVSKFKKAEFTKAFPIRNVFFNKKISAIIFTEETTEENSYLIELIAGISSMKLEIANIFIRTSEISKYYNFGKAAPQIFHEIKNKLIAPYTFIQSFKTKMHDKHFVNEFSELALEELKIIQNQIENSLRYGKALKEPTLNKNITFKNILCTVLSLVKPQLSKTNIRIIEKVDSDLIFPIPFYLLKDILLNLILNSIDSLESSKNEKQIKIKTFISKHHSGFSIEDNGIGIHDKHIPHLFESFYTTKSTGTGLGLIIVKEGIEKYKGFIEIKSKLDTGTKIIIKFPKK